MARGENQMNSQGLYILSIPGNYWKVGVASDVYQRINQLQCGCPEKITVVCFWDTEASGVRAAKMERELHIRLQSYRTSGEWFHASLDIMHQASKEIWAKLRDPELYERWQRMRAHARMKQIRSKPQLQLGTVAAD
jgi:hypothetical protein